jgi:hypothetical protein
VKEECVITSDKALALEKELKRFLETASAQKVPGEVVDGLGSMLHSINDLVLRIFSDPEPADEDLLGRTPPGSPLSFACPHCGNRISVGKAQP